MRYLINVSTNWCGMDDCFKAECSEEDYCKLESLAEDLAKDNFDQYDLWVDIAQDQGYDPDEMSEADWNWLYANTDERDYYDWNIEEFNGTDKEWQEFGKYTYTVE